MNQSPTDETLALGNDEIRRQLSGSKPALIGRFGAVEYSLVKKVNVGKPFSLLDRKMAWVNAGIWPPTDRNLKDFVRIYERSFATATSVAVWPEELLPGQQQLISKITPEASQIPLSSLDPVLLASKLPPETIWSSLTNSKRVLVVHSMVKSISKQMNSLDSIHQGSIFSPGTVIVIKPPVTNGLYFWGRGYPKQLREFQKQLEDVLTDFSPDYALVAAGAYGMPIAATLQNAGVPSLYVGGALQLMFGIMGHRWQSRPEITSQVNDFWLSHPIDKPPFGFRLVERGTYW